MKETTGRYTLDDFDYHLPQERIAQFPARPRDHSRLLIYDRESDTIRDDRFFNIGSYLPEQTTLVANNSRVQKCRLLFEEGDREIFVLSAQDPCQVEALVRPGRRFRKGRTVALTEEISAEVLSIADDGIRTLRLSHPLDDPLLEPYRSTPFPPYIEQREELSPLYQTVFARDDGSKAAPTAGLHFTQSLIRELQEIGIGWQEVTLHVGLGTFAPVKSDRIEDHKMHSEWYRINEAVARSLNRAEHLTAVGTTSVRVLESALESREKFESSSGETDIFITPGYEFRAVDAMITNFHLPKSTLLMLVAAFVGLETTHRIYRHAMERDYRFYSFGDAMLLL